MFLALPIIASIIGLLGATYTDLKERIVPNKLNYGLAITGILLYSAQSVIESNATPVLYSIGGLAAGFVFGWALWKIGVFAGGDVKLFAGLGALNPVTPFIAQTLLPIQISYIQIPFIFPITLFINSLVAFLPYGLIVLLYKLSKNKKFQKKIAAEMLTKTKQAIHLALFSAATYTILTALSINPIISIAIVIIWSLTRNLKKIITAIASIAAISLNFSVFGQAFVAIAIVTVILYGIIKLLFSLRPLLSKEVLITRLEEGMIPADTFVKKDGKIIIAEKISFKQIIKYAKTQKISEMVKEFSLQKKEIISANRARGLTLKEIAIVKKFAKEGKMPKKITIKESMPFVPTMMLGYLLCMAAGDFIIMTLLKVIF
ncbi:MAG: prepilin peptidase [Candidatus Izemoplasmatales bacterium]|jgi:preflagellin peptidase FlaK